MRFTIAIFVLMGCSSSGGGSGPATSSSSSRTSETILTCCQGDSHWQCPDEGALRRCSDLRSPDPSGCTRQSTPCPRSSAQPSPPGEDE
jgi:hypothetical protein